MNRLLSFIIIACLLTGCATSETWYNPNGNQTTFNIDSRECSLVAQSVAPEDATTSYLHCLRAKGWSRQSPATQATATTPSSQSQSLATLLQVDDGQLLHGLEQQIPLPENFALIKQSHAELGVLSATTFLLQGPDNTFLNITFQQNNKTTFKKIPYPVAQGFHLYSQAPGKPGQNTFNWTAFFGQVDQEWVMGLGGYHTINKKQRLIIAVTRPLTPPSQPPPANLLLTPAQHNEIQQFLKIWSHYP